MHHQNVHKSYMKAAKAASECPETEMSGEEALVADQVDLGGDAAAGEHAENAALPENLDALCKEHICPQCDVKTEADDEMLAKIGEKVLRVSPILNSLKTTCTIRMIKE